MHKGKSAQQILLYTQKCACETKNEKKCSH